MNFWANCLVSHKTWYNILPNNLTKSTHPFVHLSELLCGLWLLRAKYPNMASIISCPDDDGPRQLSMCWSGRISSALPAANLALWLNSVPWLSSIKSKSSPAPQSFRMALREIFRLSILFASSKRSSQSDLEDATILKVLKPHRSSVENWRARIWSMDNSLT